MITTEKTSPFNCPGCGETIEPCRHPFEDRMIKIPSVCPVCDVRRREAEDRGEMHKKIDRMAANIDSVLLGRGLTPKLLQARIEQTQEKLRNLFCSSNGVYVYGPAGTGKSFLFAALIRQDAMAILNHARETVTLPNFDSLPFFVNVHDLLRKLQKAVIGQGEGGETEADIITRFINYPYLVLDDLGVRRSTEFAENCMYEIVNAREQFLRETFFTSNYSLRELTSRIDPRTVSRIAGMAEQVIFLGGADQRLKR